MTWGWLWEGRILLMLFFFLYCRKNMVASQNSMYGSNPCKSRPMQTSWSKPIFQTPCQLLICTAHQMEALIDTSCKPDECFPLNRFQSIQNCTCSIFGHIRYLLRVAGFSSLDTWSGSLQLEQLQPKGSLTPKKVRLQENLLMLEQTCPFQTQSSWNGSPCPIQTHGVQKTRFGRT